MLSEKSVPIRVSSLGEKAAGSRGDEVHFRFEDHLGRAITNLGDASKGLSETDDGAGGNGRFLKLCSGQNLTLEIPPTWSVVFLAHPWSGLANVGAPAASLDLNLFSPTHKVRKFVVNSLGSIDPQNLSPGRFIRAANALNSSRATLTGRVIAVCCPRWRGVSASTQQLFENVFLLPAQMSRTPQSLTDFEIQYAAEALINQQPDCVVISGGDAAFSVLARQIKALRPTTRVYLLWHSNFLQLGEPHDFELLTLWISEYRRGIIDGIGVVKEGLEQLLSSLGVPSFFVENVNASPSRNELISEVTTSAVRDGPSAGLWLSGSSSYRKRPHAMLSALSLLQSRGFGLFCSGITEEGQNVAGALSLHFDFISNSEISHTHLLTLMRGMSVNIYVTLSECSPMLPIESWALGVPFIIGPSCKLVSTDPFLQAKLVVIDPSDPVEIADKAVFAASNRVEIMTHLSELFALKYQATAKALHNLASGLAK